MLGGKLPVLYNINVVGFGQYLEKGVKVKDMEFKRECQKVSLIPYIPFVPLKIIFVPNIAVFSVGFFPPLVSKWRKTKTSSTSN